MKKTRVINLVGAPSSGKSVIASLLFAELKMLHYSAEYVQEYAKTLIWKEKLDELDNQYTVSMEQYKMISAVNGKVDYICLDSPLLIGLYYNRTYKTNVSDVKKTERMILSKMAEFDNIYIFLDRNMEYPYEIAGRIHTEEESKIISEEFIELMEELGIKYRRFVSNKKNINDMLEYILSYK